MRIFFLLLTSLSICSAQAQYWFGPKIGGHRTDFMYQNKEYSADTFHVNENYNFHVGAMLIYQASPKYAVQGEITYERIVKEVRDKEFVPPTYSKSNYNYLNVPFALRWNFGQEPTFFYVSGGPKISFLLGGSGEMYLDEFDEHRDGESIKYRMVFDRDKSDAVTTLAFPEANRVQFGLALGTGVYFDLISGGRLSLDVKYSFGHSNVGFNRNPDFNQFDGYSENFRYRQNVLSLSVAYLFEYDVKLQSKGMSTIKESKKKRKKWSFSWSYDFMCI